MNQQEFERHVKIVAAKHHLTPEEVVRDVEHCIAESHRTIVKSGDPEFMREWQGVSPMGGIPTASEFFGYVAQLV